MKKCVLKYDHFENIHRLDPKLPTQEGAPNFRQVPGYLVFGTGQPTKEGFQNGLKFIFSEAGAGSCLWTNMRQVGNQIHSLIIYYFDSQLGTCSLLEWSILHSTSS